MRLVPSGNTPPSTIAQPIAQTPSLKAKAIAAFNDQIKVTEAAEAMAKQGKSVPINQSDRQQAQEHPVINPSQVSLEEMTAIKPRAQVAESPQTEATYESEVQETQSQEPKKDPTLSRQFAQLARQEKQLRHWKQQQEQALRVKELELKEKELQLTSNSNKVPSNYISIDDLKRNPLGALTTAGVTYDELTHQILNTGTLDPRVEATIGRLEAKIKSLEEAAENSQKSYKEQQDQSYKAAVRQIEIDARNLIKKDPTYEAIKATGSIKDVVELITETYNKDGILLSIEDAAQQVEDYLIEESMKLTRIGKIKSRLEQSAQSAKVQQKSQTHQEKPQMKTLTNATSSTRKLTARERALLAFDNKLRS